MTAEADPEEEAPKKGGKLPLILGVVLALAGGGGGFFVVSSGMLGGSDSTSEDVVEDNSAEKEENDITVTFIPLDPLLVSLPKSGSNNVLRFSAQLEVLPVHLEEVTAITPRIIDVLNGYLRAVAVEELADPTILARLRSQMLRRIQTVTGEGKVRDLLICLLYTSPSPRDA